MTASKLKKQINKKWDSLCDNGYATGEDQTPAWHTYLKKHGLIKSITAESHFGKGGVIDAINELIELINSDNPVMVIEDPSCDGCDYNGYLVFGKN